MTKEFATGLDGGQQSSYRQVLDAPRPPFDYSTKSQQPTHPNPGC
jgi:hypothetical protein